MAIGGMVRSDFAIKTNLYGFELWKRHCTNISNQSALFLRLSYTKCKNGMIFSKSGKSVCFADVINKY